MIPLEKAWLCYTEAGQSIELVRFMSRFYKLVSLSNIETPSQKEIEKELLSLHEAARGFYKNYCIRVDQELAPYLLQKYAENTNKMYLPDVFDWIQKKFSGNYLSYSQNLFEKSLFADSSAVYRFIENYKPSHYKKILKDPMFKLAESMNQKFSLSVQGQLQGFRDRVDSLERIYVSALEQASPGKRSYPDANLTLRVAYGLVKGYSPRDAVDYHYFTTLSGILEKEDSTIYDYVVFPRLKSLYQNRDYGIYADKDGEMHTAFIATNHTTGGNSGSPVFNADGQLIGINFDRCWEGTMSDIDYDPEQCRNISLDIRYCLFVMDKVCGAGHLVKEMTLAR